MRRSTGRATTNGTANTKGFAKTAKRYDLVGAGIPLAPTPSFPDLSMEPPLPTAGRIVGACSTDFKAFFSEKMRVVASLRWGFNLHPGFGAASDRQALNL